MSDKDDGHDQNVFFIELRQTVHNMMTSDSHQSDHYLSDDHIISAIDLKSSRSLSPSHSQQRVDSVLSSKQATSAIQSPTSYTSSLPRSPPIKSQYSNQVEHTLAKSNENIDRNRRKKDHQHRLSKEIRDNKIKKQNSWFEK
jgi:hypothetical protein